MVSDVRSELSSKGYEATRGRRPSLIASFLAKDRDVQGYSSSRSGEY